MIHSCRQAGAQPLNTFYSVKRFIGLQLDDLPRGAVQQASQPVYFLYCCMLTFPSDIFFP